jgi:DNA helicase-2/ATP-dependent DNA helicase PcrA
MNNAILEGLTDAQKDAVTHISGPLLIVAGPGSGKTRVITRRVAHLVYCGIKPWNILAITFTNKAAGEMRDRVEALGTPKGAWLSTFHSYAARVLREFADRVGFRKDFLIYDSDDSLKLIQELLREAGVEKESVTPRSVHLQISAAKERFITPDRFEPDRFNRAQQAAARVYKSYDDRLRAANAFDFDDLLMKTALLLQTDADALSRLRERHKFVLVDEFQDTSRSQYIITRLLTVAHRNIAATGDPDQSIYGWRGADINNILDFEKDFPEAKVVFLDRNYRSTRTILSAADSLVSENTERKDRTLYTENPQGDKIRLVEAEDSQAEAECAAATARTLIQGGCPPKDIAVFYRLNWLSRGIEEAFINAGVPYQVIGGVEFYARKEVKDLLAYLRLAANGSDDTSFRRVINVPSRAFGPKAVAEISGWARPRNLSLLEALKSPEYRDSLAPRASAAATAFVDIVALVADQGLKSSYAGARAAIDKSGYPKMLAESGKGEDKERIANLEELANAARSFDEEDPDGRLGGFLQKVALVADIDNWHERDNRVVLMTMHAAKGLEFPAVIITGLEEGVLPHERSTRSEREVEEERRVFFVAMTRAMKSLQIMTASRRMVHGQWQYTVPSRFLREIPKEHLTFERYFTQPKEAPVDSYAPVTSAPAPAPSSGTSLQGIPAHIPAPGTRVRHSQFGVGTVKSVSRQGTWHKLTVDFRDGERKLIYEMATLETL